MYKNNQKQYKLTEQEVMKIIQRANDSYEILKQQEPEKYTDMDFASYAWNLSNSGAYSPFMTNDTLKSLNINTLTTDKEKVDKALKDPIGNENNLIGYNQYFYFSNASYKQAIDALKALPSFDLSIRCVNIEEPKDYKSKEYKNDSKIVRDFIQKFDYRTEFKDVLWNMLMSETCYLMLRKFDKKYKLQTFPNKYALLTGEFEYGLLYDIDVNFFINNTTVDINMFPDVIKRKVNSVYGNGKQGEYNPSNNIEHRDGVFANYIQTSPEDGFIAMKFNTAHNLNIPYFVSSLPDVVLIPILRELQMNQSMAAAKKMVVRRCTV